MCFNFTHHDISMSCNHMKSLHQSCWWWENAVDVVYRWNIGSCEEYFLHYSAISSPPHQYPTSHTLSQLSILCLGVLESLTQLKREMRTAGASLSRPPTSPSPLLFQNQVIMTTQLGVLSWRELPTTSYNPLSSQRWCLSASLTANNDDWSSYSFVLKQKWQNIPPHPTVPPTYHNAFRDWNLFVCVLSTHYPECRTQWDVLCRILLLNLIAHNTISLRPPPFAPSLQRWLCIMHQSLDHLLIHPPHNPAKTTTTKKKQTTKNSKKNKIKNVQLC